MADPLSSSQRRLLELLATGLSTEEAARRLGRPASAVRDDLLRAMDALGASSKLDAIIKAIQRQQVDPPHQA